MKSNQLSGPMLPSNPHSPNKPPLGTRIHLLPPFPHDRQAEPLDSADLQYDFSRCIAPCKDWREYCHTRDRGELMERQGRKEVSACFLAKSQVCSGSNGFISQQQESAGVYLGWQCMLCLKGKG